MNLGFFQVLHSFRNWRRIPTAGSVSAIGCESRLRCNNLCDIYANPSFDLYIQTYLELWRWGET